MVIEAPGMPTKAGTGSCPWQPGYEFSFDLGAFSRVEVAEYVRRVRDPNAIHIDAEAARKFCVARGIAVRMPKEWIVPGMAPLDRLPGLFVDKFGQNTHLVEIKRTLFVQPCFTGEMLRADCAIADVRSVGQADWHISCRIRISVADAEEDIVTVTGSAAFRTPKTGLRADDPALDRTGIPAAEKLLEDDHGGVSKH
ncbi:MAG TPA: hypothetical protein VHD55_03465 [Candidatus Paceibacterota bacterium]|nr:hypothetical protein [Candidatus Paceibacterota bacterium]